MLRLLRTCKFPNQRYFSRDFILEESDDAERNSQDNNLVRLLPIEKHPIFPKHFIRFKLTQQNYDFLSADKSSNFVGAFVMKPREHMNEIETKFSLLPINPIKGIDEVYSVGSLCQTKLNKIERSILLKPIQRTKLVEVVENVSDTVPFPLVRVEHITEPLLYLTSEEDQAILKILVSSLDELKTTMSGHEISSLDLFTQRYNMKYDLDFVNCIGAILSYYCETAKIQKIFEPAELSARLKSTVELIQEYVSIRISIQKLQEEAQSKMSKANEEYIYKEILNLVKARLGYDKDEKEILKSKFKKNLEGKVIPPHIEKLIGEELEKLNIMDKNAHEFHISRNYLDWLTSLPYGVYTKEIMDLKIAKEILDRDHYGMNDVKERILEFIAVSIMRGSSAGKILCLSGPPGVGKTSIAKSIAEALNRKYFRISVGGLDDVAELKGHRRAYIGAQPGKIVSALKAAGAENAVILIDEIDKIGRRNLQGSPENTLLEILDPMQNSSFTDHYLDTSIDLSKVLFLCTANFPDNINPVLLDRMDLISVQGYTSEEKYMIFDRHLYPQTLQKCSMQGKKDLIELTEPAKNTLIRDYCREAGVRSLEKITTRILEKVARKMVEGHEGSIVISNENLVEYAGRPVFNEKKMYEVLPAGVVMGLAYTTMGGSVLYIEISKAKYFGEETEGKIQMTGNIKQVMSESIQIAYTYARKFASQKENNFLDKCSIHLHVPEGATPKDGPSAGITITTALLSLAFNKPVIQNMAMTGEISLTGKVLPIGGLKEKLVAAKREGVTTVVLPKHNLHSWEELNEVLKSGITPHFVEDYSEVYKIAFGESN